MLTLFIGGCLIGGGLKGAMDKYLHRPRLVRPMRNSTSLQGEG